MTGPVAKRVAGPQSRRRVGVAPGVDLADLGAAEQVGGSVAVQVVPPRGALVAATRSPVPSRSQSQTQKAVRPHRPPGPQPRNRLPSRLSSGRQLSAPGRGTRPPGLGERLARSAAARQRRTAPPCGAGVSVPKVAAVVVVGDYVEQVVAVPVRDQRIQVSPARLVRSLHSAGRAGEVVDLPAPPPAGVPRRRSRTRPARRRGDEPPQVAG